MVGKVALFRIIGRIRPLVYTEKSRVSRVPCLALEDNSQMIDIDRPLHPHGFAGRTRRSTN
jgi:hypothetical protein